MHELDLRPDNAIVIGSGILDALAIRGSNDIDVIVSPAVYTRLEQMVRFTIQQNHGREVLMDELFEIGTSWGVLGKQQTLADLAQHSVIIDEVRYITLDFLLAVKQSWLHDQDVRQKDIDDVALIQQYLDKKQSSE